jgi:hypothetical protein
MNQVQNLRNSGTGNGRQQPPQQKSNNEFTFPTFPAPPSMMNQQNNNKPTNGFTRLSSSSRRGESSMDPRVRHHLPHQTFLCQSKHNQPVRTCSNRAALQHY